MNVLTKARVFPITIDNLNHALFTVKRRGLKVKETMATTGIGGTVTDNETQRATEKLNGVLESAPSKSVSSV